MIDVTMIGTAALAPLPERALTSALVSCGGHSILFDCGEGTQTAARKAGVSLMKTDLIALTHYHGDHVFGLPGLLQTMSCMNREKPLYITGPAGLREELAPILWLAGRTCYPVTLAELPWEGVSLREWMGGWPEGARLTPFPTEHRVPIQGYSFTLGRTGRFLPERAKALEIPVNLWGLLQKGETVEAGGRTIRPEDVLGAPRRGLKVTFTGDTAACDSVVEGARDADLLICEATFGENDQGALAAEYGHMNFAQAAEVARRSGAKRLWLTHFSQMVEEPTACLPNAAAIFENAVCAEDGMRLTLTFDE